MNNRQTTASVPNGQKLIDWAGKHMPVLQASLSALSQSGAISGIRIGVGLRLDAKTGYFMQELQKAGAELSVYADTTSGDPDIIATLRESGIQVTQNSAAFFSSNPQILLDEGAELIQHALDTAVPLIGASETSPTGIRQLTARQAKQQLSFNVIDLNTSSLKRLVENAFGTGQSSVMAFVDITNLQLAGRPVLVVGYGDIGRGVAAHARALGARVTVAETDPVKGVAALYQGHRVAALEDALAASDVVFCATDVASTITAEHINTMPDGAFLCVAGDAQEQALAYLLANAAMKTVRADVQQYTLPNGRRVKVIAQGRTLHQHAAEGSPIEALDISFALQVEAVRQLLALGETDGAIPQMLDVDSGAEREIARLTLKVSTA